MKVNQIAAIFTGQTFRERVNSSVNGEVAVIQMRDLDIDLECIRDTAQKIELEKVNAKQLLKKGDVLFLAKGNNNIAVCFDKKYKAIASSLFLIIRPRLKLVSAEYLAYVLNSKPIQITLNGLKSGAVVGNVKKSDLEEINIPIPDQKVQLNIAKLYHLSNREKALSKQLIEQKELLIQNLLTTIVYERE
jgi:restriction endonuclease S subunit